MPEFWKRAEAKVKSAAFASFVASLLLAVLNATIGHSEVLGGFPPWLQFLVVTFGPTVATFLAGWRAKHTAIPPVSVGQQR